MTGGSPEDTTREGTFYFDPADPIYADHFPGRAVVPGSLIVHAFREEALKTEALTGARLRAEEFRFLTFLTPGEYPFRMEDVSGRLHCRLYHAGKIAVSGFLKREEQYP